MKNLFTTFKTAWANRNNNTRPTRTNVDFLPAALEILEKPPSPAGKLLGASIITLFTIAVLWACFGQVDIVAVAEGKIIPSGRVKLIQPLRTGVIKNIYVTEGQQVKAGEPLVELDQTLTAADQTRLQNEIEFLRHALLRENVIKKLLQGEQTANTNKAEPKAQIAELVTSHIDDKSAADNQMALINQHWQEYLIQKQTANSRLQGKQAALTATQTAVAKYQATIPLITKRVNALEQLHDQGLGAETQLLELKEQQVTQQQNLALEKANITRINAEISEAQQQLSAITTAEKKRNLETIEDLQRQLSSATQEYAKAKDLYAKQTLYSPVGGHVKELTIHTIGGVVEEAQTLMQIVPQEAFLEVEAVIQNKDIGFVDEGQIAEIKVHTFPFTRYGVVDAQVIDITADAIQTEQQGLVYKMRLRMDKTQLWVDKRWVDLLPGMAVSAEVKTGKRRLIEFFMAPLLRYKDESVRER